MPLVPILSMSADIKPFFALACCEADERMLRLLRTWTESAARNYVGHCISQNTITSEYQRREQVGPVYGGEPEFRDIVGDTVYMGFDAPSNGGDILQLDNGFVRSISDLREDSAARFGTGASDFAAATALTEGTGFAPEYDKAGLSKSGRIHRINGCWPSSPGTVRITYVAGLTVAELSDEYAFVKQALLEDMQTRFNCMRSQRSAGGGPIKKETYVGDYSVEYDTRAAAAGGTGQLTESARQKLHSIRRLPL